MIVRFDDTNPAKEKKEFEDAILEDLKRLGVKWDHLSRTSDLRYADGILHEALGRREGICGRPASGGDEAGEVRWG